MPPLVGPVTHARVEVRAVFAAAGGSAKKVIIKFDYRRIATVNVPSKADLAAAFAAGPYAAILTAANVRFGNGVAYIRWLNDAQNPFVPFVLAGAGATVTDSLPSYNAIYMLLSTAVRGRSYMGSKHFPGGSESDTTGDLLSGGGLANWQAVQTAILTPITDATPNTWKLCVVSGKLSQIKVNPTFMSSEDVTVVVLDKSLGTMRRRKIATVV